MGSLKDIEKLIKEINDKKGLTIGQKGSITLYMAYGSYAVDKYSNESGGVDRLYGFCTKKEIYAYLKGHITSLINGGNI
jgi:hypothetical protein